MNWHAAEHAVNVLIFGAFGLTVMEVISLRKTGKCIGWAHTNAYYATWIIAEIALFFIETGLHRPVRVRIIDLVLAAIWIWLAWRDGQRKNRKRKTHLSALGAKTRAIYKSMQEKMGLQPQREGA